MRIIRNLTIAGCSVFLLTQCASQEEVRELNYQLRAVNQKVEDVKSESVGQMQKRQANSVNKIGQIENDTLRLKSMIEENAHQASLYREQGKEEMAVLQSTVQTMREENIVQMNELKQRISVLEQQVKFLTGNIEQQQKQRVMAAEAKAREAARRAEEAKRQQTVVAASPKSGPVKIIPLGRKVKINSIPVSTNSDLKPVVQKSVTPEKTDTQQPVSTGTVVTADVATGPFDKAMKYYNGKQYQEAYTQFEEVLSVNPQGQRAAETLFYMGECLFYQGEYDLAILDYQKVISNHSNDPLTPQALLKQGMSFEKLTDIETAKIIYKKLINDFSSSKESKIAQSKLDSL